MCNVNPLTTGLVIFVPYGTINSGGSRPSGKGGAWWSQNKILGSQLGLNIRGGGAPWAPPLDPPLTNINFPSWTNLAFSLR